MSTVPSCLRALLRALSLSCVLTVFAAPFAAAQNAERHPVAPPAVWRPPVIWLPPVQEKLQPLSLQALHVDIQVRGHLATTTMELTFFNPNLRVLEGELVFPLGEGQTVSSYALEIDGKLRQAVSVPKEKAREVFESVVRAGIDPGLAELTKGNVFRTRIYPIPARGAKRVMVAFEQELSELGNGFRYLLPMGYAEKIGSFKVHAEVTGQQVAPLIDKAERVEALGFTHWKDSFVADAARTDYIADKPLAFIVPKRADTVQSFLSVDTLDPARAYFSVRVEPQIPAAPVMPPARNIAIFYDASGSAAARDRASEHAALAAYLKQLGDATVELVVFRNDADALRRFAIRNGNSDALIAVLDALPLDGGTSFAAIDLDLVPNAQSVIVVSDGLSNFGGNEIRERRLGVPSRLPLYALHAAQTVDHAALERITRRHGGRVVNLLAMSRQDGVAALSGKPFQYLGARIISGKVPDLAPSLPTPVTRGFALAGLCDGLKSNGRCEIELQFGYGGTVTSTRRIVLDTAQALSEKRGDFVRRTWAQKRIAELELDAKKNEQQITELGKDHGLITRNTSLLVLDRLDDYVRHRIVPPEPELLAQYQERVARLPKRDAEQTDAAHIASVVQRWNVFKAWHEKPHPWLESVITPAAQYEARVFEGLARQTDKAKQASPQQVDAANDLQKRAIELATRWPVEARLEASRLAWEREAIAVMLELDALRQERMRFAPNAQPWMEAQRDPIGSGAGATHSAQMRMQMPAPPPRPAAAAAPASAAPYPAAASAAVESATAASGGDLQHKYTRENAKSEPERPALGGNIAIKSWDPDTPYLRKLRAAPNAYDAYLQERKANASSSAFYLDCADFFRDEKKDERLALRVLSNLAEMELENAPLLRILAYRLQQMGRHDLAIELFEEVLTMRGEEPQSRRDLALALSRQTRPDHARAAKLLWEVVKRKWDGRFPDIEVIALHELNALVESLPASERPNLAAMGVDEKLIGGLPVELRVVLTWDADDTDIDLHIIDPAGETMMYSHPQGRTGGLVSRDFTGGYGPEVFTVRRPLPGTYTVKTNFYGNRQQKLAGATTVQVEFQTGFGTPQQKLQSVTRRLKEAKEIIEIGSFTVRPK
ncbi:hypothetical protein BH11PSE11_BH11PSE11_34440 [soil metagenome]